MRRRELLGGLFALSASGFLNSCRGAETHDSDDSHREPKSPATLKVILQGAFAVVLDKDKRYKITAVMPADPAHEFRFQTPTSLEKSAPQYRFTLEPEGLDISGRRPYMDHGLDDMNFNLGPVGDLDKDAFVMVDLPAPDVITFIPPPEPVVFVDGRIASAPLNHVLEYRISDLHKVVLRSKQLGETRPLEFSEIFKHYMEHETREKDYKDKAGHGPQFPHTRDELGRPAEPEVYTFFLGVGVKPGILSDLAAVQHGLEFFNNKLVPLFPKSPDLKRIREIRNYGDPCTPTRPTNPSQLKPSVLDDSMQKPKLLLVTSAEDCRATGLTGNCTRC
ncbi:MAG TPA: hypothetical protein VKY85_14765 [Candidatus Angelobacter sp.]|nr:hypothetical protein [Candidatus Angelobacter sp.]